MTAIQTLVANQETSWEPPLPPTDLIFDDGEPLESNRHRLGMNVLIDSYQQFRGEARDYFVGGNMFIYYSSAQVRNRNYKGPDFFVVLDIPPKSELPQGWVVWEEGGRYPDVIVELLSPSTEAIDRGTKKDLYEQVFRTRNYFVYDPFNPEKFTGWELGPDHRYQLLVKNEQGWLWSEALGLWFGTWLGEIYQDTTIWLRLHDQAGNLVLLPNEVAQIERQRAEDEHQRAEDERQRANIEQQRANMEHQRAEAAEQRAERLAAQLRELGIDPG